MVTWGKISDPDRQIAYMAFVNRENNKRHHYYEEKMKQYELLKAGNMAAVAENTRMIRLRDKKNFHISLSFYVIKTLLNL